MGGDLQRWARPVLGWVASLAFATSFLVPDRYVTDEGTLALFWVFVVSIVFWLALVDDNSCSCASARRR
jgi:hypothetical protein